MVIDNLILEYDIKLAGPTLLYAAGELTYDEYSELINLPKKERYIKTGKLQIHNTHYYGIIKKGYEKYTNLFIKENNIQKDDILEVNNDAVWIIGQIPKKLKFGAITFVKKSEYTLVLALKPRVKIYFNENLTITHEDRIRVRGATLNESSKLYKELDYIFLLYSQNKKDILYEYLHKLLKYYNKENDELPLLNNIENVFIIRKLIKDML